MPNHHSIRAWYRRPPAGLRVLSSRLQDKAYMVTGGSDPFSQDEVPLAKVRKGPYQSLLKKVAKQLKSSS